MDALAAAQNAVVAEHALAGLKPESFLALGDALQAHLLRTMAPTTVDAVLDRLNTSGRPVQLNLIGFAMAELGWPPRMPNQQWLHLSNPFVVAYDCAETRKRIDNARRLLLRTNPDAPAVGATPFMFGPDFIPREPTGQNRTTEVSNGAQQLPSFSSQIRALWAIYETGGLDDDSAANMAYSLGLHEPAVRPGHPRTYQPLDFVDASSEACLFLGLVTTGEQWNELGFFAGDRLRTAVLVHAIDDVLSLSEKGLRPMSLGELVDAVKARISQAGLLPQY